MWAWLAECSRELSFIPLALYHTTLYTIHTHTHIHTQGVVTGVLGGCNREWGMREVQIMISVMTCLTSHLDSDSQQVYHRYVPN